MKITSAYANKLLKSLTDEKSYWEFVSCHSVEVQSLYTYYCEEKSWKYLLCIKPKQLMKKNI